MAWIFVEAVSGHDIYEGFNGHRYYLGNLARAINPNGTQLPATSTNGYSDDGGIVHFIDAFSFVHYHKIKISYCHLNFARDNECYSGNFNCGYKGWK